MKMHVKSAVLITLVASLAVLCCISTGCTKEEKITPLVQIFQPFKNQSFSFGDTIFVSAQVQHPNITKVTLTLVDADFYTVEPVQNINNSGKDFSFVATIIIGNKAIENGKHYVRVQVVAQGESYNTFVEINVGELVKARKAIYALASNGNTRNLYQIDADGNQKLSHSIFGDAGSVVANGFENDVFISANVLGDLRLFAPPNDSLVWTYNFPGGGGSLPSTQKLIRAGNKVFALVSDGRIVELLPGGGLGQQFQLPQNFIPVDAIEMDKYMLVVADNPPNQGKYLFYFFTNTGAQLRKISIPNNQEHLAILPINPDAFVVLFNDVNGQAKWEGFQLDGTFFIMPTLPAFAFTAADYVSEGQLVLGSDQGIYQFRLNPVGFLPINPLVPSLLVYDPVNDQLLVGKGNSLSVRNYPAMQIVNAYSFAFDLKSAAILYNK